MKQICVCYVALPVLHLLLLLYSYILVRSTVHKLLKPSSTTRTAGDYECTRTSTVLVSTRQYEGYLIKEREGTEQFLFVLYSYCIVRVLCTVLVLYEYEYMTYEYDILVIV